MDTDVSTGPEDGDRLSAAEPEGDVRTFLIVDVRGYTSFTQAYGDEEAGKLAAGFADLARGAVTATGGEVVELRGDEALCVFRSARQALRSAVELQTRFRERVDGQPAFPLGIGIGLDAGEAVPVEDGYRGGALNLAARLCSLAAPGQILASETALLSLCTSPRPDPRQRDGDEPCAHARGSPLRRSPPRGSRKGPREAGSRDRGRPRGRAPARAGRALGPPATPAPRAPPDGSWGRDPRRRGRGRRPPEPGRRGGGDRSQRCRAARSDDGRGPRRGLAGVGPLDRRRWGGERLGARRRRPDDLAGRPRGSGGSAHVQHRLDSDRPRRRSGRRLGRQQQRCFRRDRLRKRLAPRPRVHDRPSASTPSPRPSSRRSTCPAGAKGPASTWHPTDNASP